MEKYWFKAKKYGWGWQPASWQGWLVIVLFFVVVAANVFRLSAGGEPTEIESLYFLMQNVLFIGVLILVCLRKGEKPKWRWGNGKKQWKSANDELNKDV